VHDCAPLPECVPAGHVPEHAGDVKPVIEPYVPAGQLVQVVPDRYWPAGQPTHMAADVAPVERVVVPEAEQAVHVESPPSDHVPKGHLPPQNEVVQPTVAPPAGAGP